MKLLLFSDVHMDKSHCQRLATMAGDSDVVIGAGDFGSLRMGINKTIKWLSAIEKPSVVVPGNAESFEELREACDKWWPQARVLHGTGAVVNGLTFFGLGGGIPITPFGSWSYDFTEKQAAELLIDCPRHAVLVSHSPPYGILDLSSRGQHLGSKAVREVIDEKKPTLVVCGHIHESAGKLERLGTTTVANAGPRGLWFQWNGNTPP